MIHLEQWPQNTEEALIDLYRDTDQSLCLVRVNTDAKEQTDNYIRIIETGNNEGKPFLCQAVYLDERLIGKAELTRYEDDSAELDIVLRSEYCGKGYGTQAVVSLVYLIAGMHFCTKVRAYVMADNIPAGRMLMKAGFRIRRKFKADIMAPSEDGYRLQEKTGYEFILEVPEIPLH